VPKEFQALLTKHFSNLILPLFPAQKNLALLNFRTWGVPEEKIFTELDPNLWRDLEKYGAVSSLPHVMGVDIGVTLTDSSNEKIDAVKAIMQRSKVWSHVWSEGFSSLEEVIIREAKAKRLTIGFAESCTGGLCAHRLTNVSGSSEVFWGSVVSYDNSVKENIIDVNSESLKAHGAVSLKVAEEMALGTHKKLKTDLVVALTGIAGPGGGSIEKPVGTVCLGIASQRGVKSERFTFKGDRETLKMRFSQIAFFKLLQEIRNWN
jgi:nicotinamide-nucleotide amidase